MHGYVRQERDMRAADVIRRARRLSADIEQLARHATVPLLEPIERRLRELEDTAMYVRRHISAPAFTATAQTRQRNR